jgi:hypothetical protein
MLKISDSQMAALRDAAEQSFSQEMVDHVRRFSPRLCRTLNPAQLTEAVREGIAAARAEGFTCRGPIRTWLEASMLFGTSFARDPQYPGFAAAIASSGDEMARAQRLYDEMASFIADCFGPQARDLHAALAALLTFAGNPPSLSDTDVNEQAERMLARIYPKKASRVGEGAATALIACAEAKARALGFSTPRSRMLVIVLSFAFGCDFDRDPFYPWIGHTLARGDGADAPVRRAGQLERKALVWLENVVSGNQRQDAS